MSQATAPTAPAAQARPNEMNLIWVDLEMTGLEPDTDRIIEVAVVVTDMDLNLVAEGPVFAIHQSDETLDKMDAWNKGTHGRSGLIDRVRASTVSEEQAEAELIAFLRQYVPAGKSPMCGNTICQDRRFMVRTMPPLEARAGGRLQEAPEAHGPGRHHRVDRRAEVLPRALHQAVNRLQLCGVPYGGAPRCGVGWDFVDHRRPP